MDTPRHRHIQVLQLYALGLTREEIARQMFLSPFTVKDYLSEVASVLGAKNSVHAVVIAIARGHLCVDGRGSRATVYIPRPMDEEISESNEG